jgi:hypothetical protein
LGLASPPASGRQTPVGASLPNFSADLITLSEPFNALFYEIGVHPVSTVYREGEQIYSAKS